jgi:DDE domain
MRPRCLPGHCCLSTTGLIAIDPRLTAAEQFAQNGRLRDVRCCYLYRAIDRFGALVDVRLSEKRDMAAAEAFFRSAKAVAGVTPARVTTDGHDSYPRAIRTELDPGVKHQTNQYLNNRIEQDHRGIKGRYGPMGGFESHESASRFCRCFDELRNDLQARSRRTRNLPTTARRHRFLTRGIVALRILEAACSPAVRLHSTHLNGAIADGIVPKRFPAASARRLRRGPIPPPRSLNCLPQARHRKRR